MADRAWQHSIDLRIGNPLRFHQTPSAVQNLAAVTSALRATTFPPSSQWQDFPREISAGWPLWSLTRATPMISLPDERALLEYRLWARL